MFSRTRVLALADERHFNFRFTGYLIFFYYYYDYKIIITRTSATNMRMRRGVETCWCRIFNRYLVTANRVCCIRKRITLFSISFNWNGILQYPRAARAHAYYYWQLFARETVCAAHRPRGVMKTIRKRCVHRVKHSGGGRARTGGKVFERGGLVFSLFF